MSNDKNNIKLKLYEYRIKRNLTQLELSKITGISKNTISLIERGARTPTLKNVLILATALDIEPDCLLSNYLTSKIETDITDLNLHEIYDYLDLATSEELNVISKILNVFEDYKKIKS